MHGRSACVFNAVEGYIMGLRIYRMWCGTLLRSWYAQCAPPSSSYRPSSKCGCSSQCHPSKRSMSLHSAVAVSIKHLRLPMLLQDNHFPITSGGTDQTRRENFFLLSSMWRVSQDIRTLWIAKHLDIPSHKGCKGDCFVWAR